MQTTMLVGLGAMLVGLGTMPVGLETKMNERNEAVAHGIEIGNVMSSFQ